MYLAPDGDELEIASAAATYLADAMAVDRLHGSDPANMSAELRASVAEMGWFSLALPQESGGSGLSAVEHALFFREVGRQCGPVDVLTQSLAANLAHDATLRASITAGKIGVALAIADENDLRVLGARDASYVLLADPNGAQLLAAQQGEERPSLDPATSMRVMSASSDSVDTLSGSRIWQLGQLGAAAMLVGLAEAALDQIVDYAKVRETFGKKIGSWQAVRHPCSDMAIRVEAARSQLWFAATALKEGRADAAAHLDAAKHVANQAAVANADSNIQLHGGIGVTDEHHAHLYLKHAMVLSRLFGSRRELLARLLHAQVGD
jgi:alkylation response protein AidB-like acyl-CoA dehydrogenase